jgi:transcriptional regulator with XRE-family HTH domain
VTSATQPRSVFDDPTGVMISLPDTSEAPTRTIADLLEHVGYLRNRARILVLDSNSAHRSTGELHTETLDTLLRTTTSQRTKEGLPALLDKLSSLGFSWRELARLVGVSIPALRKWRQGESASGENRHRVARLVSFCEIVREQYLIDDISSWLETPIHPEAPVTGLDLLANGRFDLAFCLARDEGVDPEFVLQQFDPEWQARYASLVDVFIAPDGQPGLRVREGDS